MRGEARQADEQAVSGPAEKDRIAVMVVDDDRSTVENLSAALTESGHRVVPALDGAEAIRKLENERVDVVVTDVRMGGTSGLDVLEHVRRKFPETAVILATGYATIESAVEAVRKGAYDYLSKPIDMDRLELLIEKAAKTQRLVSENVRLRSEVRQKYAFSNVIGPSPPMQEIFARVEQIARTDATVLIQGESGTGKELIASAIHYRSRRAEGPLIKVSCVALADGLIESELFGHERGAFTGAVRGRKGRIELADGGTLFLDEIGDLSLPTQLKLLRVLQEREIERVGSATTIPVDIRLVVATNKNLEEEVKSGRFREELYYRVRVVTLWVPALRDRREDIPALLHHFLAQFNAAHGKDVRGFSNAALRRLTGWRWPGNVRELHNTVESLVVLARNPEVGVDDLPAAIRDADEEPTLAVRIGAPLDEIERQAILATLRHAGDNKARAARILGISKKTLYRKLYEYGVLQQAPDEHAADEDPEPG
ncbi:MAG: sigma-54-dependent Fis family transcriptional regulator [Deltaproteobacteria bacterium]|nr:sigma-54-dependent Fis family transcriptional regulator [Deltaproteobacteria bacterium]